MAIFQRPSTIAVALLIGALIYLGALWRSDWTTPSLPVESVPSDNDPVNDSGLLNISPPKTIMAKPALGNSGPVHEAHRLSTADSFLPHFRALTKLRGLTMAEVKSSCNWSAREEVNFQFTNEADWVIRERTDVELDMRRTEWHDFITTKLLPYEQFKNRFEGRGIVIVAGNQQSLQRVRVILRALGKLGSRMPVELHYWDDELADEAKKDMTAMWQRLYFNDLSKAKNIVKTNRDGWYINYQLKTAAVINSRFAEPLLLDSDNIPVVAPESLYDSAVYKEYGTVFWPDIARTRPNNPIWAIANTECRMDEYEQESGQLLVDKRRYFYHLQLAAWFSNERGQYYNEFLLGDKDLFRFAWHALRTQYGSPKKWLTSVGTISDGYYCGHSFAQHHPDDGRVAFLHGRLIKTMVPQVITWQRASRGGIFQVYKRSEFDEQHAVNVDVAIKWDAADYLPHKPADLDVGSCTDFSEVAARPLDEIVPGFEKTFEEIGGYWMIDDP
jgi:alpha 1,2-mannosyltransferase